MSSSDEGRTADAVAEAVDRVPTVRLHERSVAATHLPGRRIPGVRLREDGAEVHVAAVWPTTVAEAAHAVRAALVPLALGSVDVVIDDIVLPGDPDPSPEGSTMEDTP